MNNREPDTKKWRNRCIKIYIYSIDNTWTYHKRFTFEFKY